MVFVLLFAGHQQVSGGQKPYTIMIYMNGSDLESEIGAATVDLIEILESGLRSENANIVIFTGGTNRWQNDIIPANECAIWHIEDGKIFEVKRLGLLNMGEPDTLADFITFALENYPARKYGLIMWDHGGGAIAGFGHDEIFDYMNEGSLTLPDMDYAFDKAGLNGQKLEWLGFDSCLMATVEMALIASKYAKYLVASEDLEPGDGWDYKFLALLNRYPWANGYVLGREIVDTFMDFYGPYSDEILTLSVLDLNKVRPVMEAMGLLMEQCSDKLLSDYSYSFANLAKRRGYTKTFGEGSARDNESDMVDIGDMAHHLSDLFPQETAAVHKALNDAVLYNRYNSATPLYGLSAYYVYGGLFYDSLELYAQLNVDEAYNEYLQKFFERLHTRNRVKETVNWHINGRSVVMYKGAELSHCCHYTIPARVNGKDCDVVVCCKNSQYEVLGYRHQEGIIKQKGYNFFEAGDRLAFYHKDGKAWILGGAFNVSAHLMPSTQADIMPPA